MQDTITARLETLGLKLPSAPSPVANYTPSLRAGNLLYISGQISKTADGEAITGCLGRDLDVQQGVAAARICALNILAQAQAALGSLDLIEQIVRLNGFVNATPEFKDHPQVINGASDLMVDVLAQNGRHTRAAVGVSSLPAGCAVEIDAIIAVKQN